VAIPVFTMRRFFHTSIIVRTDSGITEPAQLRGRRIGVPEYQQTWAIWSRGALQHEFGVHAREIEWFMERNPDNSHGGATGFSPPDGVRVSQIAATTNMGEMLLRGELDGAIHYLPEKNLVDRSTVDVSSVTRPLFPDPAAEGRRYYAKTGLFPINHTVVIRRSLLEQHPWIALNLYSAFVAAKAEIARYGQSYLHWYFETGLLDGGVPPHACRQRSARLRLQSRPAGAGNRDAIRARTGAGAASGRVVRAVRGEHARYVSARWLRLPPCGTLGR
jgi:4,5-dihydroxyphthalate decarboxylase